MSPKEREKQIRVWKRLNAEGEIKRDWGLFALTIAVGTNIFLHCLPYAIRAYQGIQSFREDRSAVETLSTNRNYNTTNNLAYREDRR